MIVQSDLFDRTSSVTVLLLTSTLVDAPLIRLTVEALPENGLRQTSQIMVDKAMTVMRDRIGALEEATLATATRALALFFGLS